MEQLPREIIFPTPLPQTNLLTLAGNKQNCSWGGDPRSFKGLATRQEVALAKSRLTAELQPQLCSICNLVKRAMPG